MVVDVTIACMWGLPECSDQGENLSVELRCPIGVGSTVQGEMSSNSPAQ